MKAAPRYVIRPKRMYVPYVIFCSMSGVTWPILVGLLVTRAGEILPQVCGCDLHEVVHPVAGSTKRNTIWTRAQRPDLSDDNPSAWTPAVTEVDDKQPDHADGTPTSGLVVLPVVGVLCEDDGDDDVAGSHTNGANGQNRLASNAVDPEDSGDGCDEHDDADDASRQQLGRVAALAKLLEDGRGVVKDG